MKITSHGVKARGPKIVRSLLRFIKVQFKAIVSGRVERLVRVNFFVKKQCANCSWWRNTGIAEAYDFDKSVHNWGMCELTMEPRRTDFSMTYAEFERQRVESGKPIGICSAEGIMDAELMTVEGFSCSEFIGKK